MKRSILACALLAAACQAPAPSTATPDSTTSRVLAGLRPAIVVKGATPVTFTLAERMAKYKVPGVSIAVVNGGQLAWARAVGVKEVGTQDSVTPATLFQAASISKPVAATGLLRLVDDGTIDLDRPVNEYLKSWTLPDNKFTAIEKVTLRRLASHSAGTTVHGFPGYAEGAPLPTVPQILDGTKPANTVAVRVDTTPGAIWRYSGGGITIEQLAMSDATGEAFPALMKRLVLEPMGMQQSTYEQPLPAERRAEAAAGHRQDGTMVKGRWHTYPEMAAAGLWTNPTDLMRWAMGVTSARAGTTTNVLSQRMATEMLTVQKEPSGLGPMLGKTGRAFRFEHGGANEGFRAQVIYFPETGQGAAIMTNSDAGSALASELLFAIGAEYQWPEYGPREIEPLPMDSTLVAELVGDYPIPKEVTGTPAAVIKTIRLEGGKLMTEVPGFIPKSEFLLLSDDRLIAPDASYEVKIARDKAGKVSGIDIGPAVLRRK